MVGIHQAGRRGQDQNNDNRDQDQVEPGRPKTQPPKVGRRNPRQAVRPPGDFQVEEDQVHNHPEAQGDNGQVVLLEPQGRQPQGQAAQPGRQQRGQSRNGERDVPMQRHQGRDIRPDTVEGGMAQGNLAGVADDQVEAEGQDDVDAGQDGPGPGRRRPSQSPRPFKMPWGRMSSTRIRMAKAMASLKPEEM